MNLHETDFYTYKVILSYKGTHYSGWQNQTENPNTIQNRVEKVISKISNYQNFQVIGASRTDTGVHASGQVLKIILPKKIEPSKLTMGMNSKLPQDIRVIKSELVEPSFNVNTHAVSKEYHYYFTINQEEHSLRSEIVYSYPQKLNLELMESACQELVGIHNFLSFSAHGSPISSPNREILSCSIEKTNLLSLKEDIYCFKIQGRGFLKYMVRYLMGLVWDIGKTSISKVELIDSLKTGEKIGVRTKAPAQGLHLIKINY